MPFQLAMISHTYAFHHAAVVGSIPRVVDAQNVESRVYAQYSRLPRPEQAKIRRLAGTSGKEFLGAGYSASRIAALEHEGLETGRRRHLVSAMRSRRRSRRWLPEPARSSPRTAPASRSARISRKLVP
jgi:hypothetical protein